MFPVSIFRMKDESIRNTDGMTVYTVKPLVMNVKFWKILVRLWLIDILLHVATARGR